MINVGVIGATGYTGAELLRLLSAHPRVNVALAVSKTFSGKAMGDVYPNFQGGGPALSDAETAEVAAACDAVFLCLPHGASMQAAPVLLERGVKVVDLSGDFRYGDTKLYEQWYGLPHTASAENGEAVYGLPEYFRERIRSARFVANPGCYTTTSILALAPLLKSGLVKPEGIVIDAKSGVTGAGRQEKLAYSFSEMEANFRAYNVTMHRHTSEIEEQLSAISGKEITLLFTPHLLPVKRGILATIYANLADGAAADDVKAAYRQAYENEPFTHVPALKPGFLPELKHVVGSNNCSIGFELSPRTGKIVVVSCTDNLIKGAAGQAIQNFNLMHGLDEAAGLPKVAWGL